VDRLARLHRGFDEALMEGRSHDVVLRALLEAVVLVPELGT
jgi:hypothetical protein